MARLSTLKPIYSPHCPQRFGYAPADEAARNRHRDATQHWRAWYGLGAVEAVALVSNRFRDLFTCTMCKRIVAEEGAAGLRSRRAASWQPLTSSGLVRVSNAYARSCHDAEKQRLERQLGYR